jgi:hypothetical protein
VARVRQREEAIGVTHRANEQVFTVYGVLLKSVATFKYLGRPLAFNDDDWPAVYQNLSRVRRRWRQIRCILTRDGATPAISGMFYKATVVQSVLLYGCETWTSKQQQQHDDIDTILEE